MAHNECPATARPGTGRLTRFLAAAALVAMTGALAACGSAEADTPSEAAGSSADTSASTSTEPATDDGSETPPTEPSDTALTVPDLLGTGLPDAQQTLADAGFTNVTATTPARAVGQFDVCEVTEQDPAAGTEAAADTEITVTFVPNDPACPAV